MGLCRCIHVHPADACMYPAAQLLSLGRPEDVLSSGDQIAGARVAGTRRPRSGWRPPDVSVPAPRTLRVLRLIAS